MQVICSSGWVIYSPPNYLLEGAFHCPPKPTFFSFVLVLTRRRLMPAPQQGLPLQNWDCHAQVLASNSRRKCLSRSRLWGFLQMIVSILTHIKVLKWERSSWNLLKNSESFYKNFSEVYCKNFGRDGSDSREAKLDRMKAYSKPQPSCIVFFYSYLLVYAYCSCFAKFADFTNNRKIYLIL